MAALESMASNKNIEKLTANKRKHQGNDEEPQVVEKMKKLESEANADDTEAPPVKKITTFSVNEFRSQLHGPDGLKYLRDFANCAEWKTTDTDVVLEYLKSGGTVSEITSLLDVTAQQDLATALPVFRAVYNILVKIQSEAREFEDEARRSVEILLSTHVPAVQAMVTLNSDKHRKVVLKLLTAIVTFHSSFGRQILNWFSLSPQQQEKFCEPGPVRKAFVMFLVAFFVDGKASSFRPLIEKKGLLSRIIPNLKYDDASTVAVVLTVLKEKMLVNPGVPKTLKLNIFNTQAIQSLFQLYDWVGPKGVQKGWKKPRKMAPADEEALTLVTAALDEFLMVLCTCRKNGVVFWDKALGTGAQMNQVIFTALEVIPKPWKKAETSKLVSKILESSPDLIKQCLSRWEASFEPRDSAVWVKAVDFLIEVTSSLQPELLVPAALEVLTVSHLQTALRGLLFSPAIMKHLTTALCSEQPLFIRLHGLRLLTAVIVKLNEFLRVISSHSQRDEQLKKNLSHALGAVVPPARSLCKMWEASVEEDNSPLKLSCSKDEIIADFLLALSQLDPSLLDNPRRLCKVLVQDMSTRESTVQSAVLQTISLLDPTYLTPDSEQFEAAVNILLLLSIEENTRKGSLSALATMLLSTGLWDDSPQGLDCWLGAWLRVPERGRKGVAQVFVEAVLTAARARDDAIASELEKAVSVLSEALAIAEVLRKQLKKTEVTELARFLTSVIFQLGCLPDSQLDNFFQSNQWLLFDEKLLLEGDSSLASKMSHLFESQFLTWLLGTKNEELMISEFQPDIFQWASLFNVTLHYIREWLIKETFDEPRRTRCRNALKVIIDKAGSPDMIAKATGTTLICMDPSPKTFFNKSMANLLGDLVFIGQFQIVGKASSGLFTQWMKDLILCLGLATESKSARRLDFPLLAPWKARLLYQLGDIVDDPSLAISTDLHFWMTFLNPTVEDLTPTLTSLCSQPADTKAAAASSPALGSIWLSALRVVKSHPMPQDLGRDITLHLCRAVNLPTCQPEYEDALLELIRNFPLAILDVPSDFVKTVIQRQEVRDSLIEIAELCVQKRSHKEALVEALTGNDSRQSVNGRTLLVLLDSFLQRPEGVLRKAVMQETLKDTSVALQHVDKRLLKNIPELVKMTWPHLKKYLKGKEDFLLSKHIGVVSAFLSELGKDDKSAKKVVKTLGVRLPRPEILVAAAPAVHRMAAEVFPMWLQALCTEPSTGWSWLQQAQALQSLLRDEEYLKAFVDMRQTETWKSFVNDTLRGLSSSSDPHRMAILRAVTAATWSKGVDNKQLSTVFHKCTSHSEFLSVMLSDSPVKTEVVGLLLALVRLWPSVMMLGHVPVYLAAYNASLSTCDQTLLELLREYECHCGSLSKFDPLFWGQAAISHYSVRGTGGLSLWKQVTMKSILELLDFEKVKNTIYQFPIHRKLHGEIQESYHDVYDPAFLLPLFSNLFSPGAVSYCLSFIHQGALSVTIAALSSTDPHMRGAAAVVLSRFYSHLQLTQHSKQKPVWLHVVDCIRYGLNNLSTAPVPGVVSVFLARAVLEVADPTSPLHSLHRFLLAKPAFNLRTLPEFLPLFFGDDLKYAIHRKWILEVLRDGTTQEVDVRMLVKGPAFKILLSSFTASTTPTELKSLVLQVLEKVVRAGGSLGTKTVVNELGLISWMRNVSSSISGPLVHPFVALFQAVVHCLLLQEQKFDKLAEKSNKVSRVDVTLGRFSTSVARHVSLDEISKHLQVSNKACYIQS